VTLRAPNNEIVGLQDGLFDGLQSLVDLGLRDNQISFIGLRAFSNSSYLTSLRTIDLGFNRLTSLEPWPFYQLILSNEASWVNIDLSFNWISNFTNKLNIHFRCDMKPLYGHLSLANNRFAHIMDMYNGWNIGDPINAEICLVLSYYKISLKYNPFKFNFAGNNYACDCIDFPFYTIVKYNPVDEVLDGVRCRADTLHNARGSPLYANRIPLNEFVCEQPERCPSSCRCVYRPANITLHVNCSAANLSSLPLDLPPLPKSYVKYKLDFFNNKLLRRLEHRPYFVHTSILDVSNSGLTEISIDFLNNMSHFSFANLRGNMLESFPKEADNLNMSGRLLIGDNPWRCFCENSWMIGWLQSLSHQISV